MTDFDGATMVTEDVHLAFSRRRLIEGFTVSFKSGSAVGLVGVSGSGKTTLLRAMAGISLPTSGQIFICGQEITSLNVDKRAEFRLKNIGLVSQFGNLLPELSVLANVALPLQLGGTSRAQAEADARTALGLVDMVSHTEARIDDLSGGEIQRTAIARALVGRPKVILADEPTGALDESNSLLVADLLKEQAHHRGTTVLVATHDPLVAEKMDSVINLRDFQPAVAS